MRWLHAGADLPLAMKSLAAAMRRRTTLRRLRADAPGPMPTSVPSAMLVSPNEYTGKAYVYLRPATVSELAADLVAFVDTSIADGTLVGIGPGASARNRLRVVRRFIAAANDFIARGKSAPACSHLMNAYRKVDGTAPDFAGGLAAAETRDRIIELRAALGCP